MSQRSAGKAAGAELVRCLTAPVSRSHAGEFASTATEAIPRETPSLLDRLLDASSPPQALTAWLASRERAPLPMNVRELVLAVERDIAAIDRLLAAQVDAILHHPRFKRMEAAWRGLDLLVEQAELGKDSESPAKVRMLAITWDDLRRDAEQANDFDQTEFWKKVYRDEFDMPGGMPYGLLVGDYDITAHPDDLETLEKIANTAAAAFAPFVAAAHPSLLGLERFADVHVVRGADGRSGNLPALPQESPERQPWRAFRQWDDARFVGLTLPRILLRRPYEDAGPGPGWFPYRAQAAAPGHDRTGAEHDLYLWGNAAFAYGAVAIRAFQETGWLADTRGVEQDRTGGGLVTTLPNHAFGTDRPGVAPDGPTDVYLTPERDRELSELGFLPLARLWGSPFAAFHGSHSIQQPKRYDSAEATTSAQMSAMLHYTLCVSRFAHALKCLGRGKIGTCQTADDLQRELQNWLSDYTAAGGATDAQRPLRAAEVVVEEAKPGVYRSVIKLQPHFQLEELQGTMHLRGIEVRRS